jgi:hypothetical protein
MPSVAAKGRAVPVVTRSAQRVAKRPVVKKAVVKKK